MDKKQAEELNTPAQVTSLLSTSVHGQPYGHCLTTNTRHKPLQPSPDIWLSSQQSAQTDWLVPSLVTNYVFSPQPISTHNTHTMWIGWNAVTAATDSSLASLLVADSPSHNTSTQTIVFIASAHRLPPARDDSPQSFYKHTTHISYHSGETLRSVCHPRFQPTAARHDQATVLASSNHPTTAHYLEIIFHVQAQSSRVFQPIDGSTLSPVATDVPSIRQQTVFLFQAIDDSTKTSPSKQSTSVPPPTHSTTSSYNERKTTGREHSWPRTHQFTPTSSVGVRSCAHIARTHAPHTHQTNTNYKKTVCQCHEQIHCLCSKKSYKKIKKEREPHTHHTNTKKKTHECHVCTQEKNAFCACASNVSV